MLDRLHLSERYPEGAMMQLTTSEKIFENLISAQGIPCERIAQSNSATADYRLSVGTVTVIAEVKEFGPTARVHSGGFCPVPFVRGKIRDSWRQLAQHPDESCCVVLYNVASAKVPLQPELILCAMFGELFEPLIDGSYRFSEIAAMGPHSNTIVSAVVGIFPLWVHHNCLEASRRMCELTEGFCREPTEDESLQIHRETSKYMGEVESVMRAVAVENPFARRRLPSGIFEGPFDERWAQDDQGAVRLQFSGARIAEMRELLPEFYLKMMGVW